MAFAEEFGVFLVVAILGLEEGAVGFEVTDVAELVGSDSSDVIDGVVAAITG